MPIDFRLGTFFHPRRILALHRTLERTQWLPDEERRAYQSERLRHIVRRAADRVPYYGRLFAEAGIRPHEIRTAADLSALPRLPKDTLRERAEDLLATDAARFAPTWNRTSGSTGRPVRFVLDRTANVLEFCYYWRHWSWAGYRLGDRFCELGTAHFLARSRIDDRVHWQPHLRRLVVNSARLSPDTAAETASAVRRRRPRFLKGMASALTAWAHCLGDAGIDDLGFEAVFSTGEVLTQAARRAIETTFHAPVLDSYGHMERTIAISQCERGGYHVHDDYGILELEDVRHDESGHTLGRAIGTALYNDAMPLLRYEVGDDIEPLPSPRPCPCGRTLPLVRAIHGRTQDTLVTPDGRFITSLFLAFESARGIRAAQVHQESRSRIRILVVPDPGWTDDARAKLESSSRAILGPGMDLDVTLAADADLVRDPSGKARPVIGLAPSSAGREG